MLTFFRRKEAGSNAVIAASKPEHIDNTNNVRREGSRHFRGEKKDGISERQN